MKEEDFHKLSQLCHISCSAEEKSNFLKALENILEYVDQLQEIDTSNVAPCYTVLENVKGVTSKDNPEKPLSRDIFLNNAPDQVGGMIRVPSVLKQ